MTKRGNTYAFKKNRLDLLKDVLKENLTLYNTGSKFKNKLYFITSKGKSKSSAKSL